MADAMEHTEPTEPAQCANPHNDAAASEQNASPEPSSKRSDTATRRKLALLEKIAEFEQRGAILYADAHTLRNQVHDSTSGQWRAVETRLEQLAMSWNPYQDVSAADRSAHQKKRAPVSRKNNSSSDTAPPASAPTVAPTAARVKRRQDFYELLQLREREHATSDAIKRQFRKLALRLHPDKQQQAQAQALMQAAASIASDTPPDSGADNQRSSSSDDSDSEPDDADTAALNNATAFARLRLAYETLSDPVQRAAYDAKLRGAAAGECSAEPSDGSVIVAHQVALEASTDFASLEWMARVKHKMDVMDRIAEWAAILGINAADLRFETGEPCSGRQCGKIVSMDRDLECYGSPRRRVYVCLLHRYIHACDELCTSRYGDAELDKRVCPLRAYWLIQNWLFDQLEHAAAAAGPSSSSRSSVATRCDVLSTEDSEQKEQESKATDDDGCVEKSPSPLLGSACSSNLVASEIHLGDSVSPFRIVNDSACCSETCGCSDGGDSGQFQYLDDGIYACRTHGTPHICTYEQCEAKELRAGRYVCWCSGQRYGGYREEVGTGTRTRQVVYTDAHGDAAAIEMEVPVLLPLGKMTSYLLEGSSGSDGTKTRSDDVSSLSPPPPCEKTWHTPSAHAQPMYDDDLNDDAQSARRRRRLKRRNSERETSPVRARIRRRLSEKVQQAEVASFTIHLKLPAAVANLPRVALELQDPGESEPLTSDGAAHCEQLLPIRVRAKDTVNCIKFWMEELTDQQISIWDQQILWGDTVIGDEGNVMVLDEHGIVDGCVLELRLHDDCPLLVSTWSSRTAASGYADSAAAEYNTVLISKEAEEDLEDLHDEWANVIAVEEEAFERRRLVRKREKLEDTGALNHTEVVQYDGSMARLVGVVPLNQRATTAGVLTESVTSTTTTALTTPQAFVPEMHRVRGASKRDEALRTIAQDAQALGKK